MGRSGSSRERLSFWVCLGFFLQYLRQNLGPHTTLGHYTTDPPPGLFLVLELITYTENPCTFLSGHFFIHILFANKDCLKLYVSWLSR